MPIEHALSLFKKPTACAAALLIVFVDRFGLDALCGDERWQPTTIAMELQQEVGDFAPPNLDKLMTAAELLTTDDFQRSLPDFIRMCNTLANSPTDGSFDPAEPYEMAWAVVEAAIITGEYPTLAPEIQAYIVSAARETGLVQLPQVLAAAAPNEAGTLNVPFTDDPEMFTAAMGVTEGHMAEIDAFVAQRFDQLLQELAGLKLQNPRSAQWRSDLARELSESLTHASQNSSGALG